MNRRCAAAILSLGMLAFLLPAADWHSEPGFRWADLAVPRTGKPGFTLLSSSQMGVTFTNVLPLWRSVTNTILPNGSGVAAGDIDGDGWCDLFFSGLAGGSRMYRNLGDWRFEDITALAGVVCTNLDATGTLLVDLNGDGSLDLIVNSLGGGTHLFLNNGAGRFTRLPQVLNAGRGGTSLAAADTTGKGNLDLYVANYRAATILDAPGTRFTMRMVNKELQVASINGRPPTDPEWTNRFRFKTEFDGQGRVRWGREELGEPDVLLLNKGNGQFEPVSWTSGRFLDEAGRHLTEPPFDWGLSVLFRDFNQDSHPDIYVCNDFLTPDRFWLNDGRGHFLAVPLLSLRQTSFSSMGADVADINRDGLDDLMVMDMLSPDPVRRLTQRNSMLPERTAPGASVQRAQYPRNMVFLNRGDGTYAEIAQYAGIEATDWSWAPIFLDVDLDGFEDLLVPNGFERDNMNVDAQNQIKRATLPNQVRTLADLELRKHFPRLATPNLAFRNRGDLRFEEVSSIWGFDTATISQGACLADLDCDGDLDVVLNNLNEAAGLYRNDALAPRLAVRLRGQGGNTRGIGARVIVSGGPVVQSQEFMCGGRYQSCDDAMRVFAAASSNRMRLEVVWRSGRRTLVAEAQANRLYEIQEPANGPVAPPESHPEAAPLFVEVSERIAHRHTDQPFDDGARQPSLATDLSQLGPGISWWDMDRDGIDDLIVGSGKGGLPACYRSDGKGGFARRNGGPWDQPVPRDHTGMAGWRPGKLLAASSNYEDHTPAAGGVFAWETNGMPLEIEGWNSSMGSLAVADYNGDGHLDLFVGGRVRPGQYPLPAESRLFLRRADKWALDEQAAKALHEFGMVCGAVWSDLNEDGWPELLVSCDWGPIRILRNERGQLAPFDPRVQISGLGAAKARVSSLSQLRGWWTGITTGDLNGDGRMDIVAANWGANTRYERFRDHPLRLYYGDLAQDGTMSLIEAAYPRGCGQYLPVRMLSHVAGALPFIGGLFPTHQSWAQADLEGLMKSRGVEPRFVSADWLETTLFLNRGDYFEVRVLPAEAQFAPGFAVCVADADGDGTEDVFLGQNFYGVDSDTSRYDAGRGLWLKGDGRGGLRPIPGQESGIRVYGQQAGAALCDFNGDGRVDLAVAQNNEATRLFQNSRAKPGIRIRLQGPEDNPCGIGATVRLQYATHLGPSREIHGGGGWWSQDSLTPILGFTEQPLAVRVRWPGGVATSHQIAVGTREVLARWTSDRQRFRTAP